MPIRCYELWPSMDLTCGILNLLTNQFPFLKVKICISLHAEMKPSICKPDLNHLHYLYVYCDFSLTGCVPAVSCLLEGGWLYICSVCHRCRNSLEQSLKPCCVFDITFLKLYLLSSGLRHVSFRSHIPPKSFINIATAIQYYKCNFNGPSLHYFDQESSEK